MLKQEFGEKKEQEREEKEINKRRWIKFTKEMEDTEIKTSI